MYDIGFPTVVRCKQAGGRVVRFTCKHKTQDEPMLYLGIKELIHWAECLECLERPSVTISFVPEGLGQAAKGGAGCHLARKSM